MRTIALCVATFAVGWLVGGVLTDPGTAPRTTAPRVDANAPERTFNNRGVSHHDAADFERDGPESVTNTSLRKLSGSARREIDELLATDRAATVLSGDGTIKGAVRDLAGDPVAGVVVTALHAAQPVEVAVSEGRAREQQHADRNLEVVATEAIKKEIWRREMRRTATTGSDGRFEITGLVDMSHRVTAYHIDFDVRPLEETGNRITPDATLDFVARPILAVPVEVKLPDGELTEHAWLGWNGPHGRGGGFWTKAEGTVRMPVGPLKVSASTTVPVPARAPQVEYVVVEEGRPETLVLQLENRRVLTARLIAPEGLLHPERVEFRLWNAKVAGAKEKALLKLRSMRKTRTATRGKATWLDVEPGSYVVGAIMNKRRILGTANVLVGTAPVEVDLRMEEPHGTTVQLISPDGGPVPGGATFHVHTGPEGKERDQRMDAMKRADGSWFVFLDMLDTGKRTPGASSLRVATKDYGSALTSIHLGAPGTVVVRLKMPSKLTLRVNGMRGKVRNGLTLYAALRGEESVATYARVSGGGRCKLTDVQPGRYDLLLVLARGKVTWTVLRDRIRLGSGDLERRVTMPALHTLRVRMPKGFRGRRVRLTSKDATLGELKRDGGLRRNLATFDALAAGSYEIHYGKKSATIRVPAAAEVQLR